MTIEEQFAAIGEKMLEKATAVPCGIYEYIEGLKGIIETIGTAIEASEGDLERQEEESMAESEDQDDEDA